MKVKNFSQLSEYLYPLYILFHPIDGYQELKWNRKWSFKLSLIILAAWFIAEAFYRLESDFEFNPVRIDRFNIFFVLLITVILFVLAVIANWSCCTLMEGKGRVPEIWISCSYALIPMILSIFIVTILSKALVLDEGVFLTYILFIGRGWTAMLLFYAVSVIHDYSYGKTIGAILLTFAGVLVITLLATLAYSLFLQMAIFVRTIFSEIVSRL